LHAREAGLGRGQAGSVRAVDDGAPVENLSRHAVAPCYAMVSAPLFTFTEFPLSVMTALRPLSMVMPSLVIEIFAPLALWMRMPLPGTSRRTRPLPFGVCRVMVGERSDPFGTRPGTSAWLQYPPTQMG